MKVTFDFTKNDLASLARIDDEMSGIIFEDIFNPDDDKVDAANLAHEIFEKTYTTFERKNEMPEEDKTFKYPLFVAITTFVNNYILLKDFIKQYPWLASKRMFHLYDGWVLHTDEKAQDIILTNKDNINYIFESTKPSDMSKYLEVYISDLFD